MPYTSPGAIYLLQLAFIAIAVVAWWGKALLHIPPHFTWPFSKLLAFPHASNYLEVGAVTVLPWVAMCDRFSNLLARVVFPERVSPLLLEANLLWYPVAVLLHH
jgi:hypothetical protein